MWDQYKVAALLAQGECASDILEERCPGATRRIHKACKMLKKTLEAVQGEFPDAQYYTGGGGFSLLLGDSHLDHEGRGFSDRVHENGVITSQLAAAESGCGLIVGDGDY